MPGNSPLTLAEIQQLAQLVCATYLLFVFVWALLMDEEPYYLALLFFSTVFDP